MNRFVLWQAVLVGWVRSHLPTKEDTGASLVEIEGGMVPFPDQMPDAFAATILNFLDSAIRK